MKTAKRISVILLAVAALTVFSGCDVASIFESLTDSGSLEVGYTVEFGGMSDSQKRVLETRLHATGFEISSATKSEDGSSTEYVMTSTYTAQADFFEYILGDFDYSLTDESGKVLLSPDDVTDIYCDDICLDAYVSEDFALEFPEGTCYLQANGKSYEADVYYYSDENKGYYISITMTDSDWDFETLNDAEMALFGYAVALTDTEISEEIDVNFRSRT